MSDFKEMSSVNVYRGKDLVGSLFRNAKGATFEYQNFSLSSLGGNSPGIAFSFPLPTRRYVASGSNLHPFFAGLLPEGLRLSSLIKGLKTSPDDLFTLLLAAGADTIGDISVNSSEFETELDISEPENLDFHAILSQEIKRGSKESFKSALPGVQNKLSASMISLPLRLKRSKKQYLLKLTPPQYPLLVENEYNFLLIAKLCGVEVNEGKLVTDAKGNTGLLVTRFDREFLSKAEGFKKLHVEDACQFLNRYPSEKYRLTHREIAEGIQEFSSVAALDLLGYIKLVAFSYLIGNGDLHGKNISLIVTGENLTRLSPAYDLLSTIPYGDDKLALKFEGRDDNLRRVDFINFAKRHQVPEKACSKMLDDLSERLEAAVDRIEQIGFSGRKTEHLRKMIIKRIGETRVTGKVGS